jgi:hypothetical protein
MSLQELKDTNRGINDLPYYFFQQEVPLSNTVKGLMGEAIVNESTTCYHNIKFQSKNDIDQLIFKPKNLVFNETKNLNEDYTISAKWLVEHVIDRFALGLPISESYARQCSYQPKDIIFSLTITKLNCSEKEKGLINSMIKGLKINVIEFKKQVIDEKTKTIATANFKRQFRALFGSVDTYVNSTVKTNDIVFCYNITSNKLPFLTYFLRFIPFDIGKKVFLTNYLLRKLWFTIAFRAKDLFLFFPQKGLNLDSSPVKEKTIRSLNFCLQYVRYNLFISKKPDSRWVLNFK